MLFALSLPCCLSPTFIVVMPIDGASIIPLDELPIIKLHFFNKYRYLL